MLNLIVFFVAGQMEEDLERVDVHVEKEMAAEALIDAFAVMVAMGTEDNSKNFRAVSWLSHGPSTVMLLNLQVKIIHGYYITFFKLQRWVTIVSLAH